MIRNLTAACALALLALAPSVRAQEPTTAEGVLKKAIDASGGMDALKKFPAMRQKVKGTMEIAGMELNITADVAYMDPDKAKVVIQTAIQGQKIKITQIINGKTVHLIVAGQEQQLTDEDKEDMRESLTEIKINLLYPLLDAKAFEVKLLPDKAKVGDDEAYVLTVKPKDAKEYKVFFDAKTFLISKTEKKGKEPGTKKEGTEEEFLSDYKKVQGVMVAMKSKSLFDGAKKSDTKVTEIKLLEKIEASEFDVSD